MITDNWYSESDSNAHTIAEEWSDGQCGSYLVAMASG